MAKKWIFTIFFSFLLISAILFIQCSSSVSFDLAIVDGRILAGDGNSVCGGQWSSGGGQW